MSFAFLFAALAAAPTAMSVEANGEKCASGAQCDEGQCCASACTGQPCSKADNAATCCAEKACPGKLCANSTSEGEACASKSAAACESKSCSSTELLTAALDGGANGQCSESSCHKSSCSEDLCSKTCCDGAQNTVCCEEEEVVIGNAPCVDFTSFPAIFALRALAARKCESGNNNAPCCADTAQNQEREIVALHRRLMEESAKNKVLTAELKYRDELAKAQVEFSKKMLQKEVEVAYLHTQLQLADVRSKASQELAEAAFEFERSKAEQAKALAVAELASAGLAQRVAELEKQLESIQVRLANRPIVKPVKAR